MPDPVQGSNTSIRIIPQTAKDVVGADGSVISASAPSFKSEAPNFVDDALTGRPQAGEVVRGKQKSTGDATYTVNRSSILPMAQAHFGGHRVRGASGFYVHEYWYDTMQFHAFEQKMTNDAGSMYLQFINTLIGTTRFSLKEQDLMKAMFGIVGGKQIAPIPTTSLITGTLTDRTGKPPLSYLRAFVKIAGTKVATVQSLDINSDRHADTYAAMDETSYVSGAITGKPTLAGTAKMLLDVPTYTNLGLDPDNIQSVEAVVPQGNFFGVGIEMPNVKFQLPRVGTNGLLLHDQTLDFDASGPVGSADVAAQLRSKFFTTPTDLGGLTLIFTVTGAGAQTITFASGDNTPALVAAKINATATLLTASVERMFGETGGSVVLKTIAKGSGVTLTIGAGTANTALGFTDTTPTPGLDGQTIVLRVFTDVAA